MLVEQETSVAVRAGLHGARRLEGSAVKQRPPEVVARFDFHPHVEGIDRAARKEVSDLPRAHDHFETNRLASRHRHRNRAERAEDLRGRREHRRKAASTKRLFTDGKCRCLLNVAARR